MDGLHKSTGAVEENAQCGEVDGSLRCQHILLRSDEGSDDDVQPVIRDWGQQTKLRQRFSQARVQDITIAGKLVGKGYTRSLDFARCEQD